MGEVTGSESGEESKSPSKRLFSVHLKTEGGHRRILSGNYLEQLYILRKITLSRNMENELRVNQT